MLPNKLHVEVIQIDGGAVFHEIFNGFQPSASCACGQRRLVPSVDVDAAFDKGFYRLEVPLFTGGEKSGSSAIRLIDVRAGGDEAANF